MEGKDSYVTEYEAFYSEIDKVIKEYDMIETLIGTKYYVGMEYKGGIIKSITAKRTDPMVKISIEKKFKNLLEYELYVKDCIRKHIKPHSYPYRRECEYVRREDLAFMIKKK